MPGVWKLLRCTLIYMVAGLRSVSSSSDIWPLERPDGMPAIQSLEVMCGKDHMDVHLSFSQPFEGIVSSKGQHADPRCVYVPPSTGQTFFSFRIAYARCGTKPDMHGQFYENTVVVQYDKDLLEVWDEAKRLRCEWFNDYEKTASKPPMVIADLDVIQLDFRGDNVDCWMEIQHGKGPWAPPVSGIVPLGSTLTLVVAINDYRGEFDMRVKSCVASDGGGHTIQLSDEFGCVLRPKMISRFLKARGSDDRATVITYAFFHAFKFPDALSVHIKCKVEICRHGCLDHCQLSGSIAHYIQERKDQIRPQYMQNTAGSIIAGDDSGSADDRDRDEMGNADQGDGSQYEDVIQNGEEVASIGGHFLDVEKSIPKAQAQTSNRLPSAMAAGDGAGELHPHVHVDSTKPSFMEPEPARVTRHDGEQEQEFPHGPRNLEEDDDNGVPLATPVAGAATKRRGRSVTVTDRKARSADVGVSGIYEVISEADLAFSPDTHTEAVTVFQGRIREEVVYGICLPMPGFSALFIVVALSAVVSALVAGAMLHRLQAQREMIGGDGGGGGDGGSASDRPGKANRTGIVAGNDNTSNNGWLPYGLLRARCAPRIPAHHPDQQLQQQQQEQTTNGVSAQVVAAAAAAAADPPSVERG